MAIYDKFQKNLLNNISGPSYIGNPKNNTMMYLTKKIEMKLSLLSDCQGCLIFLEANINVPETITINNSVVLCENPVKEYTEVAAELYQQILDANQKRSYKNVNGLYYIGENVKLGQNVVIEPGTFIDHDVTIGNNSWIKAGAVIRYGSVLGENCTIGENAVIGDPAFNTTRYEDGTIELVPSFGNVVIGYNVYIGANTIISRGSADDTILEDNVKVDSNTRVGHDVHLHKGVELLGCAAVAGYCEIDENTVVASNATLKNRLTVGRDCYIGMGSVVHHNVKDGLTMSGSPAKSMNQIGKQRFLEVQMRELVRKHNNK